MFKNVKKVRTKILLPSLTVLIVALLAVGITSAYLNYSGTMKTLDKTLSETLTAASARVTAELDGNKKLAQEFADTIGIIDQREVLNYLSGLAEKHDFSAISITDPQGLSILESNGQRIDVSDRKYFTVARDEKRAFIADPEISRETGELTVFISAPIIVDGHFQGIVLVGMDAAILTDIVNTISVGDTGTACIINKAGTTIAYKDYKQVTDGYNTQEEVKSNPELAALAALERDLMAGKTGFGEYHYGGANKLMAYAPIASTQGWGMYVTAEKGEFTASVNSSVVVTATIVGVFVLIATLFMVAVAKTISVPIGEIEKAAEKMSRCDYDIALECNSKDEIGALVVSMGKVVQTTKTIVSDLSRAMNELANENFDIHPEAEYLGVFKPVQEAMHKIVVDLSSTVGQVIVGAEQVSDGSNQVASGAQTLAQGATEQASSVQQLSASIAGVSEQIRSNAENAGSAAELMSEVGGNIATSNVQMAEMMGAMGDISTSSQEISKIIKTIEDIAFQTNILALNAAVEAARAGAAGKGFAVVADEVRNLATKSSEAAKQTNVLIEGSVGAVDNGVKIADETAKSLAEVVAGAEKITDLISKISTASAEQATAISQINQGVEQISAVVQMNSATSEESAAASEELNGQANMLKNLVSGFKLSQN
ncbi:MAG: methyl-accepting chemotaxis protein [Oscillospiraceae bacterium]